MLSRLAPLKAHRRAIINVIRRDRMELVGRDGTTADDDKDRLSAATNDGTRADYGLTYARSTVAVSHREISGSLCV